MTKFQFKALVIGLGFLILLMLWMVLPPVGWAIIGLVAFAYGLCWVVERAVRKVWRR